MLPMNVPDTEAAKFAQPTSHMTIHKTINRFTTFL